MTKRETSYIKVSRAVSEMSNHPKHKIGCVVVLKHRVISSGTNSDTKTHPLQKRYNRYRFTDEGIHKCHAELSALLPLIRDGVDLSDACIYTYKEHKDGSLACSRPCKSCMQLIKDCRIKRIFYTTELGYAREDLKL